MSADSIQLLIKHSKKLELISVHKISKIIVNLTVTAVKRRMPGVAVGCRCAAYIQ